MGMLYLPEKSPSWRDRIALELSRLRGVVASGLIFYFECGTKDARMGSGTCSMKCNGSDDAYQKSA